MCIATYVNFRTAEEAAAVPRIWHKKGRNIYLEVPAAEFYHREPKFPPKAVPFPELLLVRRAFGIPSWCTTLDLLNIFKNYHVRIVHNITHHIYPLFPSGDIHTPVLTFLSAVTNTRIVCIKAAPLYTTYFTRTFVPPPQLLVSVTAPPTAPALHASPSMPVAHHSVLENIVQGIMDDVNSEMPDELQLGLPAPLV
ncbi:hypothetical protein Pelo_7527 [Pelomyxa schiedti]|nr:hypothetical protein Pelo_7527 [Pelomyxa schiedti]